MENKTILRRLILFILTLLVIAMLGGSLIASLTQPQIQSRLELYQTNLILHATEWRGSGPLDSTQESDLTALQMSLLGKDAVATALEQYTDFQNSVQEKIDTLNNPESLSGVAESPQSAAQLEALSQDLSLQIGLLQARQGETTQAFQTWQKVTQASPEESLTHQTATVLTGLWNDPARILPNSEGILRQNLDGWFQYQALNQLYTLQQRGDALEDLTIKEQEVAQSAVVKLAIVSGIPATGLVLGTGLLLFLGIQWLLKRQDSTLARNANLPWKTPWSWETVLQVFVVGFFFLSQFVAPILFQVGLQLFGIQTADLSSRSQAILTLISYLSLALGGLVVLYLSLRPFLPLPDGWFRLDWLGNWPIWGLGGYLVALPLVIAVSLLNQLIWQGQGGSNPILPIALENRDQVALIIFFITASIAAPLFEEIMFRGFLLPSLTRYFPVWGAIVLSSFLFALAHNNISEVIPLTTLGMVLGLVYTRSRNLLSSMLLHSLWNSGTLIGLYVLGSGVS
ncbi:MAG: type II CAAX prenyl endopeptidase Rce1 family protein [Microcoleaceae cyanobacterium]